MTSNEYGFLDEIAALCEEYEFSYSELKDLIHYNRELLEFKLCEGEFTGESND